MDRVIAGLARVSGYNIRARLDGASEGDPVTSQQITNLLKLVGTPRDGALLRFSLGSEYLKSADFEAAAAHLGAAVEQDPGYSAAWKLLGKALAESGRDEEALASYRQGIEVAEKKGAKQAAKAMEVV